MTKFDIEEKRLRRLEKRIRHLEALLKVTAIFGGSARKRTESRVRDLWLRECSRMWQLAGNMDPEEAAKQPARVPGEDRAERKPGSR